MQKDVKYDNKNKKSWLIGKSRRELFGIATVLVLISHSGPSNWAGYPRFLVKLSTLSSIGVDVFLLLSGMGLYYSMKKCGDDVMTFYRHRIRRIIPSFLLITGILYGFMVLNHQLSFGSYLLHISTLYWWTGGHAGMVCFIYHAVLSHLSHSL